MASALGCPHLCTVVYLTGEQIRDSAIASALRSPADSPRSFALKGSAQRWGETAVGCYAILLPMSFYERDLAARHASLSISLDDALLTYCLVVNVLFLERGEDRRHAQYCWTVPKQVEIACTVQHIRPSYPYVTRRRWVRETWPSASRT